MENSELQNKETKEIISSTQRRQEMTTPMKMRKLEVYLVSIMGNQIQRNLILNSYKQFKDTLNGVYGDVFPIAKDSIEIMDEKSGGFLSETIEKTIEAKQDVTFLFFIPSSIRDYGDIRFLHPDHDRVHVITVSDTLQELLHEGEQIMASLESNKETA